MRLKHTMHELYSKYTGKSVKEVADIVGVAEATVKTRMFYARKKLAELVERGRSPERLSSWLIG